MPFEPIAIVGQSCVLPGALSVDALWEAVVAGRDLVSRVDPGRWGLSQQVALSEGPAPDRAWSDRGGYVRGFEQRFDPQGFALDAGLISGLDPAFQWAMHCGREALGAGFRWEAARTGLVMGNLSFPSGSQSRFAEGVWFGDSALVRPTDTLPHNRFNSGLPAHLTARALGLGGGAFALDAACASSLYAIKLACDRLHDREIDVALAGAVNRCDDLFIHVGFCALTAMSKTGQTRPFHAEADGLVPAEGAAFVALKRLSDAQAAGDTVLGVIRGVGLSNDGRGRGLLVPSEDGQERAIRAAYAGSGLTPDDVGLLECHATGTPVGDGAELRSTGRVFAGRSGVPMGSLKSNMGHLITAAGAAGLLKVLGAMKAGVRPPTLHVDAPHPELSGSPFRLLTQAEPWDGPRRAGVSAFGFGGNNAHVLVEAPELERTQVAFSPRPRPEVAVVALGVVAGDASDRASFEAAWLSGRGAERRTESVEIGLRGLRTPPNDLKQTLGQQTLLLRAAFEALEGLDLPMERAGALIGMGCDAEVSRYGARWRMAEWLPPEQVEAAREGVIPVLQAAGVLGTMPNIPANRLSSQFDLRGPSFTLSSEELSGMRALDVARRALETGELDAAFVGAVDLSDEPVHRAALQALGLDRDPADAAVLLVLRRAEDARAEGQPVLALLGGEGRLRVGPGEAVDASALFGDAHAASGLLQVAAATLCCHRRALPGGLPWVDGARSAQIKVEALGGEAHSVEITEDRSAPAGLLDADWRLERYAAPDRAQLKAALLAGRPGGEGSARLALVAQGAEAMGGRRQAALMALDGGPMGEGVFLAEGPPPGELALAFTGAAAATPGMGRSLLLALPELAEGAGLAGPALQRAVAGGALPEVLDQLWSSSALSQAHAAYTLGLLGLKPQAALGLSSGESNALVALGAWPDLDGLVRDAEASGLFTEALGGPMRAVAQAWGEAAPQWQSRAFSCAPQAALQATEAEPRAHLAIVYSPRSCVVSGEAAALERVAQRLGQPGAISSYPLAVHVPELGQVAEAWTALHHRETRPVPGVRFYSAGRQGAYAPDAEAAAQAILTQAVGTLNFPAVVEQAYADGVRVFIEHGPGGHMSRWIGEILAGRPHLALPLDVPGLGLGAPLVAAAALWAAGFPCDLDRLISRLEASRPAAPYRPAQPTLQLPAHSPPVIAPARTESPVPSHPASSPIRPDPAVYEPLRPAAGAPQRMAPAPSLPPVMEGSAPAEPISVTPMSAGSSRPVSPAPVAPAAAPVAVTPVAAVPVAAVPVAAVPVAAGPAATSPAAPPLLVGGSGQAAHLQALAQQAQWLGQVHQDYLAQQTALHEQFLEMRAALDHGLQQAFGAFSVGGAPPTGGLQVPTGFAAPTPSQPAAPRHQAVVVKPAAPQPPVAMPVAAPVAAPVVAPAPVAAPAAMPVVEPVPVAAPTPAASPASAPEPASGVSPYATLPASELPGPKWDKDDLRVHASGAISALFGPEFVQQDAHDVQVRMPEPPLLLADRVVGLKAEPGTMGKGVIWTETDVVPDAYYMHQGTMPAGYCIESGQADLMLISYLGVDFLNQGERAYRLLGCDLTYHAAPGTDRVLPAPGETLRYEIHVDGHANQGPVRLFFFHYDCTVDGHPRLDVRYGQAGFFTREELDDSKGVLWEPEEHPPTEGPLDAPAVVCERSSFTADQVRAFAEARVADCFGPGFERASAHTDTPRISAGRMLYIDEVTHFEPKGGPWGRGYLRAVDQITPEHWFFQGHFKNDPCMPGNLMFEACLQTMAFYIAGMGYTLRKDGWRFEPVPEETYKLRCRGQVIPESKELIYEVFVHELHEGPYPTLYADILCTVDGLKAFHCYRMGLRLVPGWPLQRLPHLLEDHGHEGTHAVVDGFPFDYASLLACAWGRPSKAFGPMYTPFDGTRHVARLPGPPYHFMSRVSEINGPIGVVKPGARIVIEYDIPEDCWYQRQNGNPTMPFAVLLEAALQPCGWLASFVGSALTTDMDLYFRNLDGTGTLKKELTPGGPPLRTAVHITNISQSAGMIIQSFEVVCTQGEDEVYVMDTVFGFFPRVALENQIGLPTTPEQRALLTAEAPERVDLTRRPERYCAGSCRLPAEMLLMLDRAEYWPEGGEAGLGRLRGEKDVDPTEWFFKAHFYSDPVQPGSLGIEAMVQLLQFYMLREGMHEGMAAPRFEALALDGALTWKYRGQVVPHNKVISSTMDVTERGRDERGAYAIADASLWVDGKRIYEAKGMAMRIVDDALPEQTFAEVLDPAAEPWLADHAPTFTLPALPMMSMVDRLAAAAHRLSEGRVVTRLEDVRVKRWLVLDGPVTLRDRVTGGWDDMKVELLDAEGVVAQGTVHTRHDPLSPPQAFTAIEGPAEAVHPEAVHPEADPYASGRLFHGPAFQLLKSLVIGDSGASAVLDAGAGGVPYGHLHQGLLDAATHAIPHDQLHRWCADVPEDQVAYPAFIPEMTLHGPLPTEGDVRCEVRWDGFHGTKRFPRFKVQLAVEDRVIVAFTLVEALFPKGPLGVAEPEDRRAFLAEGAFVAGLSLSKVADGHAALDAADVTSSDWLPGTVAQAYGVEGEELLGEVAAKDLIGQAEGVHPRRVSVADGVARSAATPLTAHPVSIEVTENGATATRAGEPRFDLAPVVDYWTERFAVPPWPVEDLYYGLIQRFVRRVVVEDPAAHAAARGRSVLYLGNHQVGLESLVFSILASALNAVPTVTLAKIEHKHTWLGKLIAHSFSWPGVTDPEVITFFDREDKSSLPRIIGRLAQEMVSPGKSVMVHVEGTRSLECRTPVQKMSGAFIDMALKVNAPIVPVRFVGGLPPAAMDARVEFPTGMGAQDIWLGRPILPEELAGVPYGERKQRVIAAINGLGPSNAEELPNPGDPAFAARVAARVEATGSSEEDAVLVEILAERERLTAPSARLLQAFEAGELVIGEGPEEAWLRTLAAACFGERGPTIR